ncbi:MAG: DUF2293 domain-containing protein [Solirubrobacteraceae bacterium]
MSRPEPAAASATRCGEPSAAHGGGDPASVSRLPARARERASAGARERGSEIAHHAAVRGSGRVGRSAAGRALQSEAIELAVLASVRHRDTRYDELLMSGVDRASARTARQRRGREHAPLMAHRPALRPRLQTGPQTELAADACAISTTRRIGTDRRCRSTRLLELRKHGRALPPQLAPPGSPQGDRSPRSRSRVMCRWFVNVP